MIPSPRALAFAALVLLGSESVFAQADTARVLNAPETAPTPAKWHLFTNGFYSTADNGFGVWRGADARLLYSGKRLSPFFSAGSQTRPNGTQATFGAGSYITLTPWMFSIVGVGMAPDNGVVLFPKLRTDASVFVAVPGVKGVLVSTGITDLRFTDSRAGGRIVSLGSMVYRGPGIYSAGVFLNSDRASGANSSSWQAGAQWGAQGKMWFGLGGSAGNEAYRVLSVSGFDARFRTEAVYGFVSKWVTPGSGVGLRYDYEHKVDVYHRNAFTLTYFVDF